MLGTIADDVIGSVYEHIPIKTTDFPLFHPDCRFTDDTVLIIGVAQAILTSQDYAAPMRTLGLKYPDGGLWRNLQTVALSVRRVRGERMVERLRNAGQPCWLRLWRLSIKRSTFAKRVFADY